MKEINIDNFVSEVKESELPVLLEFWAPWCQYCDEVSELLQEFENAREDVKFCSINVNYDKNAMIADAFEVKGLPTILYIADGKVQGVIPGVPDTAEQLSDALKKISAKKG